MVDMASLGNHIFAFILRAIERWSVCVPFISFINLWYGFSSSVVPQTSNNSLWPKKNNSPSFEYVMLLAEQGVTRETVSLNVITLRHCCNYNLRMYNFKLRETITVFIMLQNWSLFSQQQSLQRWRVIGELWLLGPAGLERAQQEIASWGVRGLSVEEPGPCSVRIGVAVCRDATSLL